MRSLLGLILFVFLSYTYIQTKSQQQQQEEEQLSSSSDPTQTQNIESNNEGQKGAKMKNLENFLTQKPGNETPLQVQEKKLSDQDPNKSPTDEEIKVSFVGKDKNESSTKTEKFVASVISNVLKTDTGQKFFSKVLTYNKYNSFEYAMLMNISEINLIDRIFGFEPDKNSSTTKDHSSKALCGNKVNLTYEIFDMKGNLIASQTLDTILGQIQAPSIVENLALNMKVGNKKKGIIPATYIPNQTEEKGSVVLSVSLNQILENALDSNQEEFKVFDKYIGSKMPYMCGQKAEVHMKITSLQENKVVFNEKYEAITGHEATPAFFSYAVPTSFEGNVRTIICKAGFLNTVNGDKTDLSQKLNLDLNTLIMIEIKH